MQIRKTWLCNLGIDRKQEAIEIVRLCIIEFQLECIPFLDTQLEPGFENKARTGQLG